MEEDECIKMLDHLQQYVPHLEKLIAQLKDPKRRNRELQLNKLEGLHSMITDRKKKLKLDTLKKCEDVILKILHKVHPNIYKQFQQKPGTAQFASNMVKFLCKDPPERTAIANVLKEPDQKNDYVRFQAARARLSEIFTPASPSPPRDNTPLVHKPIVIPTEQVKKTDPNPDDFQITNWKNTFDVDNKRNSGRDFTEQYKSDKPDVYSQAGESLSSNKKIIFERLGSKVDMSKPPLSMEDLELLASPDNRDSCFSSTDSLPEDNYSMDQLQDLRQVLQKKLQQSEDKMNLPDLRNKLNNKEGTSKFKAKKVPAPATNSKPKSPRVEKVYKNPDSTFGNLLSSIDERILGDAPIKKKEKKDQTKDEKPTKSDSKSHEKDSKKSSSKKEHHDKKDSKEKKSHKDEKKEQKQNKKGSSKEKESDKHKSTHTDKNKEKTKHDKKPEEKSSKHKEGSKDYSKFELSSPKLSQSGDDSSHKPENKDAPVYKRLADKYNPKPRKNSVETVIEDNRKLVDTGQAIPTIENIFSSPPLIPKDNSIINNTPCEIIRPIDSRPTDPRNIQDPRQITDPRQTPIGDPKLINDPRQLIDPKQINDPRQMVDPKQINDPPRPMCDPKQVNDPRQLCDPKQMNDPRQMCDPKQMNDPRQMCDPRQINDPRQMGDPRQMNDTFQMGDPRRLNDFPPRPMEMNQINEHRQNVSWFDPASPNFEAAAEKPSLLGRSPLLKMLPQHQRNSVIGNAFMSTPSTPNSMQIGFPANNPAMRQNEMVSGQSLFVPTQHNVVNQNISTNHGGGGNTYMNTFILQSNLSSSITHSQYNNATQNTFHPPAAPSKAFHPYEPIESSEYDLSKMQPTDFYSPTFTTKVKRPLGSTPPSPFPNRGPYGNPYPSRERATFMGRSNMDSWASEGKNQWPEGQSQWSEGKPQWPERNVRDREDTPRPGMPSRDPRIRAREKKDRNDRPNYAREPPLSARRKSVDERTFERTQNKYDSLYSNLDRTKDTKETFMSPLDSLYATGEEKIQKTGKGYGVQKFRIPKKRTVSVDSKQQKEEKDGKRDTKDVWEEKTLDQEHDMRKNETTTREVSNIPHSKEIDSSSQDDDDIPIQERVSESNKGKVSVTPKDEDTPSTSEVKKVCEVSKASPSEESMLANFLTKLITKSEKKELLSAIFSTLTDNISDQQKNKFKRIQKIVDSDSDDDKVDVVEKLEPKQEMEDVKPIQETKQIVNPKKETKDSVEDEEPKQDDESPESDNESEDNFEDEQVQPQQKKERNRRRPLRKLRRKGRGLRRRKRNNNKKKSDTNKKTEEPESPNQTDDTVIETVGERIKSRRRNLKTPDTPKGRKCRTELDMLHDDIKEMFIRDGVLTATGKRMCRMLKPEEGDPNLRILKTRSTTSLEEELAPILDSPKRRARTSNPKVIIEKTDFSKLVGKLADESGSDSESLETRFMKRSKSRMEMRNFFTDSSANTSDISPPSRRTRTFKSKPNYTEDTDEELPPQLSDQGEESFKENESETTETHDEPPVITKEVTLVKKANKKKKRVLNWASGIIKKRKRKASSNPVTPTPSIDGDQHSVASDFEDPPEHVQEDNDSEIEYIEPDMNYYFDPHDKAECKICPFKGKMIVQHYKTTHPKHEVLISRISPDNAKKAIDESVEKGYEDIDASQGTDSKRRKKYTYQCRFCQVFFKNENSELFFDHLTSHTGEYRFICSFCPFKTANSKSLRSHFHTAHQANSERGGLIFPVYPPPPDFHLVFGYMCGECNFIQMDRSAVVTHVKIYHLGDNQNIYKISMSMIDVKPTTLQISENVKISEIGEEEKQKPSENVKIVEKEINDVIAEKTSELLEKFAQSTTDKVIPTEIPSVKDIKEIQEIPVEAIKEDPTVFKYNIDYVQENMILEEEKHEKMKEINLTIIPRKKFTSNLLDKIKSRLDDKVTEAAVFIEKTDETVFEEIAMQDNLEEIKILKKSVNMENSETKKLKLLEPKTIQELNLEKPIINKNSVPITNIIERLQGILNVDAVQPPPLIPLNEFNINFLEPKTEDVVIQVGPVAASKKNSYILYICYMQSCMFSSTNQSEFEVHCTTLHNNEGWDGFCNICKSKTGSFEVVNAFKHLINVHECELKLEEGFIIKKEPKEEQSQTKSYIRMRRLSGDKLSELHSENSESSCENKSEGNENKKMDDTFKILDVPKIPEIEEEKVSEEPHNFPFQITNVISLAENEEEEEEEKAASPPTVPDIKSPNNLDTALQSLTIINATTSASTPVTTTTSIAFQLPIQSTSGAGYSLVLPVLTPINKSMVSVGKLSPTKVAVQSLTAVKPTSTSSGPKTYSGAKVPAAKLPPKKIMLKDTPLQPEEIVKLRKTQSAKNMLLTEHKLVQLYKCPEKSCPFSTDSKKQFETHLNQHPEFKPGKLVVCLYCNFKTDVEFFGVHCDIRHGRCQYCCSYCFYRAINQSYVEMHQEMRHANKPRHVLMVGLNPDALMSQAQIQMPLIQSVVPLFVCGQLGCEGKFIFPEHFKEHLSTVHNGVPLLCFACKWCPTSPENAVIHMQTHSIYQYHCRYCLFGGTSTDEIHKHLANHHFALRPMIVLRQLARGATGKPASEYNSNDPASYEELKVIMDENYKYITPAARFEVIPVQEKLKKSGKNSSGSTTITPILTKNPTELNKNKRSLLKTFPKQSNVTIKLVKNIPADQKKNDSTKLNTSKDNDSDVEIVSEDETTPVNVLNSLQVVGKTSARSKSPIVLNKFLKSPDLFGLTQKITKPNKIVNPSEEPKSTVVATKEVSAEPKKKSDYILVQPVSGITLDEPFLEMRMGINNTTSNDIDPLQLESEACTVIPEDGNIDTPIEHTFTEAKLDVMSNNYGFVEDGDEFSDLTADEASFSADETMKKQGLSGRDLFRCGFCRAGFETSTVFKTHVTKCVEINKNGIPRPFKCAHCIKAFKSLGTLSDHVRLHGTLRFSCSLCDFKHQHQLYVRSHLKNRHKITSVILTPVDPNKRCLDEDEFVVRPKINRQRSFDGSTGSKDGGNGSLDESIANRPVKSSYGPDEISSVPIRPIFSKEIKCAACGYLTKVRANLIRHLQFHTTGKEMQVPATAPINPVPCLEKNEKMFDKMTNLSLSSYNDAIRLASKVEKQEKPGLSKEEEAQLPGFVTVTKRYVCGASSCDYLCLEESMLRYHLLALHTDESFYKCMHCDEKLSSDKGVISVEFIIKHLRLHDLHLYKCRYCKFLHHLKHKVDRHVLDKHSDQPPVVIIVRELEQEPEDVQEHEEVKETKEAKPWRCGMCKYRCTNKKEIISHAFNKHDVDIQFKCALCQFTNHTKSAFFVHFENDHPGQNIDVIDAYYEVEETGTNSKSTIEGPHFDTTPLWQRDKNKFKHIRGIPLDESKLPKKSPMKIPNSSDNLDKAIEAVASGVSDVSPDKDVLKNPLSKKPKTLKEKKMEIKITSDTDVIEIADDEEKNPAIANVTKNLFNRRLSDISKPLEKLFSEKLSEEPPPPEIIRRKSLPELITKVQKEFDEDTVDISLKEIEDMDLETLKNAELTGTYGPFGKPSFKQFLCPLCSIFKTKKVEDITHHLYKELHYFRFVCTNCALTGITFNFLHKHSVKKHLTESIHPLSPNPRIEQWVQKVLAIQRRIIENIESTCGSTTSKNESKVKEPENVVIEQPKPVENLKAPKDVLPDSSTNLDSDSMAAKSKQGPLIHQCQHCSYCCKAASDLRKHERRHWVQKPLKCGYCDVEGVTKYEVLQHAKRAHPNLEPLVIPVPMPSNPTIKPISRKRKLLKNSDNTESTKESAESSKDTSSSTDDATDSENFIFLCSFCSKSYNTKDELKIHWDVTHKSKLSTFKFQKIARSQFEETGSEGSFIDDDVESEAEDIIVFVCNYCPKRCNSEAETRTHWEMTHKIKQPAFKYKKLMRSQLLKKGSLNYKCCFCEFIGHLEVVKKHFIVKHPNLAFSVYRYKCGYCGQYLRNMEKAKIHTKHLHGDFEPSYVNIEDPSDDNEQEKPKEFNCEHCSTQFELRKELVDHHKSLHSHLELNLPPDLSVCVQEEGSDLKQYLCPQCQHSSNSYAAMRDHLRNHAKPYQCNYCAMRFTYPSLVKSHHGKEHPDAEYKYITIEEANKMNESLRKNLLVLTKDGTYENISQNRSAKRVKGDQGNQARKVRVVECGSDSDNISLTIKASSNKSKKVRNTARKSTTQGVKRYAEEGYSYYGTKPDLSGLENVRTKVSFMDSMVTMNIAQFRGFLDISPTVAVVDIIKYKDEL